jgi:hypothetical protein
MHIMEIKGPKSPYKQSTTKPPTLKTTKSQPTPKLKPKPKPKTKPKTITKPAKNQDDSDDSYIESSSASEDSLDEFEIDLPSRKKYQQPKAAPSKAAYSRSTFLDSDSDDFEPPKKSKKVRMFPRPGI